MYPRTDKAAWERALNLHHRWVESLGEEGQKISLLDEELAQLDPDLSAIDWTNITLSQADLPGCIFYRCDLKQMNMNSSYFGGAIFIACDLTEASFVKANFDYAIFRNCNLTRANFFRTDLHRADFNQSDLREADFQRSFLQANLHQARFEKAALTGANFGETDLRGATGFEQALIEWIDRRPQFPNRLEGDAAKEWLLQQAAE